LADPIIEIYDKINKFHSEYNMSPTNINIPNSKKEEIKKTFESIYRYKIWNNIEAMLFGVKVSWIDCREIHVTGIRGCEILSV